MPSQELLEALVREVAALRERVDRLTTQEGVGFANPMTAAGDLIVGGAAGAAGRLAAGSDRQSFRIDPTTHLPVWWTWWDEVNDPATLAMGQAAAKGASYFFARHDHAHGMPSGKILTAYGSVSGGTVTLTTAYQYPASTTQTLPAGRLVLYGHQHWRYTSGSAVEQAIDVTLYVDSTAYDSIVIHLPPNRHVPDGNDVAVIASLDITAGSHTMKIGVRKEVDSDTYTTQDGGSKLQWEVYS